MNKFQLNPGWQQCGMECRMQWRMERATDGLAETEWNGSRRPMQNAVNN